MIYIFVHRKCSLYVESIKCFLIITSIHAVCTNFILYDCYMERKKLECTAMTIDRRGIFLVRKKALQMHKNLNDIKVFRHHEVEGFCEVFLTSSFLPLAHSIFQLMLCTSKEISRRELRRRRKIVQRRII